MRPKIWLQAIFWILVYILLTTAPLLIILIGPTPPGREFWRELSVALGFVGLSTIALQFVLTARFKTIKAPFGSDIIYFFHRQISIVAFFLVAAHPLLLFIFEPQNLGLLNLVSAPWAARFGVVAVLCVTGLIGLSIWRKKLRLEYNRWRIWHGLLATAAVALAMAHILLRAHYLNTPFKANLWSAYGIFWIGLLLWVRVIKPFLLLRQPWIVDAVIPERGSTWTLALKPLHHAGMKFMPGQFAWITAWNSPFKDSEHPFSISSSAEQPERITFTIKELGDFTRTIKDLQPGQRVYVDGPFGAFSYERQPHAAGYNFIAGGVGITPMLSMLRTLADRGDTRPLTLIYGNRDWDTVTCREELEALQQRLNLKVVHVLEKPPEGWQGESGYITAELLDRHLPADRQPNRYETFICGPQIMMDNVEQALVQIGVPLGDFHSERFDLV